MRNKDDEFYFLIALGIFTILNIINFLLVLDEYNRHHQKKSLKKETEDKILYTNRKFYALLALFFFLYNKNALKTDKENNYPNYIIENATKELIVSFLLLSATLINLTVYNYDIEDIYY